jgi:HAE1 family hydrophobic/amphiphilic exporter-1
MAFYERLLTQRVLVNLTFVIVIVAGLFALSRMPVEEYPNVAFDNLEIVTLFPGASPADVERLVTREIEDEIEDVKGIEWVRSVSALGYSRVLIKVFDDLDEDDVERVHRDLQGEVRKALREFPSGVEAPVVNKLDVETVNPVISVVVGGDVAEADLRDAADDMERRVEALPGVRQCRLTGRRERELYIEADPDALAAHDLSIADVVAAVRARAEELPAGSLEGAGGAEVALRSEPGWQFIQEVLSTPVRTVPGGGAVLAGDVAEARAGWEEELVVARYRGRPAILLGVIKETEANALEVRGALETVLREFEAEYADRGVELATLADTTIRIRDRIGTLGQNLGVGAALVLILLTWTLGFRMSLLALKGVAFAFIGAFAVLGLMGQSINALSLFGLVLVSGMLVDDAIVVIENICRRREMGEDRITACVRGASEVAWPVTSAVLTSIAAFLPLLLMSGVTGKFFAVIPISVCSALVVSLVEVLFIMPVHLAEVGTGVHRAHEHGHDSPSHFEGGGRMRGVFDRVLVWTTSHRRLSMAMLLVVGVLTVAGFANARFVFFPSEYQIAFVNLRLPPGSSLERSIQVMDRADAAIRTLPETVVESTMGTAGFIYDYNYQPHIRPHFGQMVITFARDAVREVSVPEAMQRVRDVLARTDLDGARVEVTELNDGPPIGRPVAVRVQGDELEPLMARAREVEAVVREVPGVKDITSSLEPGAAEAVIRLDDELAAAHGVTAREVALTVAAANDGLLVGRFEQRDESWDLRVRLAPGARRTLADLEALRLRNGVGALVAVGDVARLEEGPALASIERWQGRRTVFVTADVDPEVTTALAANREIARRVAPLLEQHPEMGLGYGGEFEQTQRSFTSLGQAFLIALLAMYAILGTQFRSYTQPLVILCAVPFGVVGVVVGVYVVGDPVTVPTLLGVVGLAGVSVNDSIVLVDFANQNRRRGMDAMTAVRNAAHTRLRPVLLTSLTTVAGLLPSAVGIGAGGRSVIWGPMATAFCFGLGAATVLTLLVTPVVYLGIDRLAQRGTNGHDRGDEVPSDPARIDLTASEALPTTGGAEITKSMSESAAPCP